MDYLFKETDFRDFYPGEGPFFTDYLYNIRKDFPNTFGLEQCDWSEDLYPRVASHKEAIINFFNEKYYYREIGQENEYRWQQLLQLKLDETIPSYDLAFRIYEENDVERVGGGYKFTENKESKTIRGLDGSSDYDSTKTDTDGESNTINHSNTATHKDDSVRTVTSTTNSSSTNNQVYKDTPTVGYTAGVNLATTQQDTTNTDNGTQTDTSSVAGQITNTSTITDEETREINRLHRVNDTRSNREDETTDYNYELTQEKITYDNTIVDDANKTIDKYRNLIRGFVDEFNDMFIGIYYCEVF